MKLRKRDLSCLILLLAGPVTASPGDAVAGIVVRHVEGDQHALLGLRSMEGKSLADGDLVQHLRNGTVESRLSFRFHDGSFYEENVVYTQQRQFRVVKYRQVLKGPAFRHPLEMTVDTGSDTVSVRYSDHGAEKTDTEHMAIPLDLANGMLPVLLKNVRREELPRRVSILAATPAPRLVKLEIAEAGEDTFRTGAMRRKAVNYQMKVRIGGVTGLVASVMGKIPPDSHVWILAGEDPAFISAELALESDAPLSRIEPEAPVWPKTR